MNKPMPGIYDSAAAIALRNGRDITPEDLKWGRWIVRRQGDSKLDDTERMMLSYLAIGPARVIKAVE